MTTSIPPTLVKSEPLNTVKLETMVTNVREILDTFPQYNPPVPSQFIDTGTPQTTITSILLTLVRLEPLNKVNLETMVTNVKVFWVMLILKFLLD